MRRTKDENYRCVISSAKPNGNTATLVREALKGATEAGASVTEIFLSQYKIEFCIGCSKCTTEGKCHFNDDFEKLRNLLYEADGIILGSPTYTGAPNAIMKCLIERLGLFERLTSSLGGKYVVGISPCSSMGGKKVAKTLVGLSQGIFQRGYVSGIMGVALSGGKKAEDDQKALKRARWLGGKIALDIKNGKKYPLQNCLGRMVNNFFLKPIFHKLITDNKEGTMKIIYGNLRQRGLIG